MSNHRICNTVEAKTKLNELLDEVEGGREVVIQRRGRTVAKLIAASEETMDNRAQIKRFMARLRKFHQRVRAAHGPKGYTIELLRELRKES